MSSNLEQPFVPPVSKDYGARIRELLPKRICQLLEEQGEPIKDANGSQVGRVPIDGATIKLALQYVLKIAPEEGPEDESDRLARMTGNLFKNGSAG